MPEGMQHDPIQGQGQEPFRVNMRSFSKAISAIYKGSWQLTMDS